MRASIAFTSPLRDKIGVECSKVITGYRLGKARCATCVPWCSVSGGTSAFALQVLTVAILAELLFDEEDNFMLKGEIRSVKRKEPCRPQWVVVLQNYRHHIVDILWIRVDEMRSASRFKWLKTLVL